jgi:hypothetical protein
VGAHFSGISETALATGGQAGKFQSGLDFLVLFSQVGAKRRSAGFFGGTKVTKKNTFGPF